MPTFRRGKFRVPSRHALQTLLPARLHGPWPCPPSHRRHHPQPVRCSRLQGAGSGARARHGARPLPRADAAPAANWASELAALQARCAANRCRPYLRKAARRASRNWSRKSVRSARSSIAPRSSCAASGANRPERLAPQLHQGRSLKRRRRRPLPSPGRPTFSTQVSAFSTGASIVPRQFGEPQWQGYFEGGEPSSAVSE
jgi:hypothetical protein